MTKLKELNPNKKLEESIINSDLPSLAKDYAELAIDGILDDGILKGIPLVGTVVGIMKFSDSISKHLAAKKIYKFLFQLDTISPELRRKKVNEINSSGKYASTVGEITFELLDKMESDGKPEILGKLFKGVIEEKLDFQAYLRIAHMVRSLFYYDLLELKVLTKNKVVERPINDSIFTSGLTVTNWVYLKKGDSQKKPQITLTDLGEKLVLIGMK